MKPLFTKIKFYNDKYYIDIFLLAIVFLLLPANHTRVIKNIFLWSFVFIRLMYIKEYRFNMLLNYKFLYIILGGLLALALASIPFSADMLKTFREIKSDFFAQYFILFFIVLNINIMDKKRINYIFIIMVLSLIIHTCINIFMWQKGGFWPFRAHGLVSTEKFGIWATYALSISIALFYTKYKKVAFLLIPVSLVSIVANNTRATFLGMLLIIVLYFLFFYRNRFIKYAFLITLVLSLTTFIFYSKKFGNRYNVYNTVSKLEKLKNLSPSEFEIGVSKHGLDFSILSRLSMYKAIIIYRNSHVFTLNGYGRNLYGKQIREVFKNQKENLPFAIMGHPHNNFLGIYFSLGILGLVLFILLFLYNLKTSLLVYKNSEQYKYFGVYAFFGTIGYIASLSFADYFGGTVLTYFYILFGINLGILSKNLEK